MEKKRSFLGLTAACFGNLTFALVMSLIVSTSFGLLIKTKNPDVPVKVLSDYYTSGIFLLLFIQLLCLIMLICLLYVLFWNEGNKDYNLIETGHMKNDRFKGLKVSLLAMSPGFLLNVVLVFTRLGLLKIDGMFSVYKLFNNVFYGIYSIVAPGFDLMNTGWAQIILLFVIQMVVPAVSWLCYWLGLKRINLIERLVYKKQSNG